MLAGIAAAVAIAMSPARADTDFERDVAPLLGRCLPCHSRASHKGGLSIESREELLRGGKSGEPAIVSGAASESPLIEAVTAAAGGKPRMPRTGAPLTDSEVATLREWINGGAPWPDGVALRAARSEAGAAALAEKWAFESPRASAPPAVRAASFVRDPIDAWIAAKLESAGLEPSPEADPRTLIRRATLDVTGLPPSPEDVAMFVAASRADPNGAYARLVDRLLASPRYGERCAVDWLDVVRFAETQGFEMNLPRPEAWPYRDWVIAAFNDDRPWGEFVRAQLAGDQLGEDAATGFLVAGAYDEVKSPDPELTAVQRDDELHGMVSVASAALLGLTVGCAKCHDHKFDPIGQSDYYALRACFEGVQFGTRPWHPDGVLPGREPVSALRNVERFAPVVVRRVRFVVNRTNVGEPCLDELELFSVGDPAKEIAGVATGDAGTTRANVAIASLGAVARASSVFEGSPKHTLEHVNDGRYGNDHSWIPREPGGGARWVEIELARPTAIDTIVWSRDREGAFADRLATDYRIEALVEGVGWRILASSADRRPAQAEPQLFAGRFDPQPPATHRLERGNPMEPREIVAPSGLACVDLPFPTFDEGSEPARRLALADWIASPGNPLTARVIVNRIWQQHFGRGLVETPSDFGAMGARPSHPELVDQLAVDLLRGGGRLKAIHRRILLSSSYRQSSAPREDGLARDADARLLWRFPPRRLPAEAIRDSMLAVAGALDLRSGGPGFTSFAPNDNYVRVYEPKVAFVADDFRRSIYMTRVRMHPDGTFGVFDAPDGGQACPRRAISNTPLQALALTHAPFVQEMATRFAARLERECATTSSGAARAAWIDAELVRACELAFQREPAFDELSAARTLVRSHGLVACCRALLAAGEFSEIE